MPKGKVENERRKELELVVTDIQMPESGADESPSLAGSAIAIHSKLIVGELQHLEAGVGLPGVQGWEVSEGIV